MRCVVVTGAGRAFCAGADLGFVHAMPADRREAATMDFLRTASALMCRVEAFPKPVIAAVNGVAVADGLELVLCCNLALAAESARLGNGPWLWGQRIVDKSILFPHRRGHAREFGMLVRHVAENTYLNATTKSLDVGARMTAHWRRGQQ